MGPSIASTQETPPFSPHNHQPPPPNPHTPRKLPPAPPHQTHLPSPAQTPTPSNKRSYTAISTDTDTDELSPSAPRFEPQQTTPSKKRSTTTPTSPIAACPVTTSFSSTSTLSADPPPKKSRPAPQTQNRPFSRIPTFSILHPQRRHSVPATTQDELGTHITAQYSPPPIHAATNAATEKEGGITELEMSRAVASILQQVDWERVSRDVASNRGGGWYRRAVGEVLGGVGKGGRWRGG